MTPNWIKMLDANDDDRRVLEQERLIMQVTEVIASLMEESKISRADLAKRIGKSPAFVTKVLRGENNFTLRTVSDLLFALGRSAHLSIGEIGEPISLCHVKPVNHLKFDNKTWNGHQASWNNSVTLEDSHVSKDFAA